MSENNIHHATTHRWLKTINNEHLSTFGKSNRSKVRSLLGKIDNFDISHEIVDVTPELFDWFLPMYQRRISEKNNPIEIDIKTRALNPENKYPYKALILHENGLPIGATLFTEPKKKVSIAFRTYENRWSDPTIPANPSLYTEYLICEHALAIGANLVVHGREWNPYGVFTDIGLCTFKLSIGCQPALPKKVEFTTTDLSHVNQDILLLKPPTEDKIIREAILYTKRETEEKHIQVTKYPEQLQVEVIYRD